MRSKCSLFIWYLCSIYFSNGMSVLPKMKRANSAINDVHIGDLENGRWVKLICGASNQDIPTIRNLCYIYTIAGVNCIDMSADPVVVAAAYEGMLSASQRWKTSLPYVMISVNDDADPHFRKAIFDPEKCPIDCSRPCERVCPAAAIPSIPQTSQVGVIADRCYGCGRCVPVCPLNLIETQSHVVDHETIKNLFSDKIVNAIEIHTQPSHGAEFKRLWDSIATGVLPSAKVIAVSFPEECSTGYIESLQETMASHEAWPQFSGVQIWQTDGRPMSGDIGKGTARAASAFASRFMTSIEEGPARGVDHARIDLASNRHFIQLAGGTNLHSMATASEEGLLGRRGFGGFAFGGYARKNLAAVLRALDEQRPGARIEDHAAALDECLRFATALVQAVKSNGPRVEAMHGATSG